MTISSRNYSCIALAATSYSLFCGRISEKRALESDRQRLRELGDYIGNMCNEGIPDEFHRTSVPEIVRDIDGLVLLLEIEKKYLDNANSREDFAGRLRELGITSLDKLAAVLKKAENEPEFERYSSALNELFTKWHDWAEELSIPESSRDFVPFKKIGDLVVRFPSKVMGEE
jgi:hypothetical protein